MARPRKFKKEEALEAAMLTFWRHGFSETSYDKLVQATGASRKGLYGIWHDKEELFLECLKLYREKIASKFFESLRREDLTDAAYDQMWRDLGSYAAKPDEPELYGCLVCRSIYDAARHSEKVTAVIDQHYNDTVAAFEKAIRTLVGPENEDLVKSKSSEAASICVSISSLSGSPFTDVIEHMKDLGRKTRL